MLILDTLFHFLDFIEDFWLSVIHIFLLYLLLDQHMCPDGMLIVGCCLSSPQTEAKETLDFVHIELRFYSRLVVVSTLLVPT